MKRSEVNEEVLVNSCANNIILTEKLYEQKIEAYSKYHNIVEQQNLYKLDTRELINLLKQFFIVDTISKSIYLEVNCTSDYIKCSVSIGEFYKLIFSIAFYLIKICESGKSVNIDINQKHQELVISFSILANNMNIMDIEKYITHIIPNHDSKLLNWTQIKLLFGLLDYEFVIRENEIIIKQSIEIINTHVYFKSD